MKIGIITFHWATNYGAVLQAYALQTYLTKQGYNAQIINYTPYTCEIKFIKCLTTKRWWRIPGNLLIYLKELKFRNFRNKYLHLSTKYISIEDLKKNPPPYQVYICGSDQIWNPSFTAKGEKKITLSYFLDFGSIDIKRIAYAASFGCTEYPKNLQKIVVPSLLRFKALSVRERSGLVIMHKMGVSDVSLMPDPTLLLQSKDYDNLITALPKSQRKYCFYYALHTGQKTIEETKRYLSKKLGRYIIGAGTLENSFMGIDRWLSLIKSSDITVTNSFHGMIFSIIFKKPFIVVPVEGSRAGMNDRIYSLLENIGLQGRILDHFDLNKINTILAHSIDWDVVDTKIDSLRIDANLFLKKF